MIPFRPVLALSVAAALVLSACGGSDDAADDGVAVAPAINIGRTNDPLSQLLAEIYGQGLENAGYRIGRKDPVADEKAAIDALQAGTMQFFPETTASLLAYLSANGCEPTTTTTTPVDTTVADSTTTSATETTDTTIDTATTDSTASDGSTPGSVDTPLDSSDTSLDTVDTSFDGSTPDPNPNATENQLTAIRSRLPATLVVTDPAGVNDGLVVACGAGAIDKFSLALISDLGDATDLKLGGTTDFQAADVGGLDALNTAYGTSLTLTTVPDVAAAITAGTVDCGVLPAMTPEIIIDGLIVLNDDKAFAVDGTVLAVMSADAGQADVLSVIDAINAKLTSDVVHALLVKVKANDQPYDVVAKQFLASVSSGQ